MRKTNKKPNPPNSEKAPNTEKYLLKILPPPQIGRTYMTYYLRIVKNSYEEQVSITYQDSKT